MQVQIMGLQRQPGPYDSVIPFIARILEEPNDGRFCVIGVDHRPARDLLQALVDGEEILAHVEDWQILSFVTA